MTSENLAPWEIPGAHDDVPIMTGDIVRVTMPDGDSKLYEVTKGHSPDTVWVDPAVPQSLQMRRINGDD